LLGRLGLAIRKPLDAIINFMDSQKLVLSVLPLHLSVCRFKPSDMPTLPQGSFYSITRTADELSIVCEDVFVPQGYQKIEAGWRALKVEGPLNFSLTGILAALATPLAEAKISIFAISTYDTDYVLVKEENLIKAIEVLSKFCEIK
jgi:hypothetical protein